ncbi:MAG TPA: anthranilate/aminodeoxychorismate synthase component II, partial [Deltaproteobacteria bacterium]|nr:anthranilate/aminodeoxychorismate synthase component II [Deltaproteobacteria bacterium]
MIVVIDNYDSFTYNLVQYLSELGADVRVYRNDAVSVTELGEQRPDGIVISPGPGGPGSAGISCDVIRAFSGRIPILGVCLGHQCVGEAFGGKVVHARSLMHGKTSRIRHNGRGIFSMIENPMTATRYHSLALERESLPPILEVCAESEEGEVMGIRHVSRPVFGVQFHPES